MEKLGRMPVGSCERMTGVRLVLLYTLLFVVGWLPVAGYLALNGSSMLEV